MGPMINGQEPGNGPAEGSVDLLMQPLPTE
jgi:hypothetical protein